MSSTAVTGWQSLRAGLLILFYTVGPVARNLGNELVVNSTQDSPRDTPLLIQDLYGVLTFKEIGDEPCFACAADVRQKAVTATLGST